MIKIAIKNILAFFGCFIIFAIILFIAGLILSLFPGELGDSLNDMYRQIR